MGSSDSATRHAISEVNANSKLHIAPRVRLAGDLRERRHAGQAGARITWLEMVQHAERAIYLRAGSPRAINVMILAAIGTSRPGIRLVL